MSRPCKVISSQSRHNTKAEIEERKQAEESLKGKNDKIKPAPKILKLNDEQIIIYNYIVDELVDTDILNNLDIFVLGACAEAVEGLINIRTIINKNPAAKFNNKIIRAKDTHSKDFYRCMNELSLSPQSRAKLGSLALANKEKREDPLLKALQEDDDE